MRLLNSIILSMLVAALLVSCSNHSAESKMQFVNEDELFRLILFIDKLKYKSNEKIDLFSTLEYTGLEKNITISHGLPYINYSISDGKDFNVRGVTATILTHTTLDKGKVYTFPYFKSGAFSEDDPDADFWRTFYSEKDLYLPPGNYTLAVYCNFSLTEDVVGSKYSNMVEIEISVQ